MKNLFLVIAVSFFLLGSSCKKECHTEVVVVNNSQNSVVIGQLFSNVSDKCRLDGPTIQAGESAILAPSERCWEESKFDFYVLDAATYDNSEFTNCDSLYVNYTILTRWQYNTEKLKSLDFKVSYP